MTDYTKINEEFQKFIDANELDEHFKYTGENDYWEYIGGYPAQRFFIHNKSCSIESLINVAYNAGQINGRKDQLNRTMMRFQDLISPDYNESIWI